MRTTVVKPADQEEWLKLRAPYIGASECAALFNEHGFITAADLAVTKLTGHRQTENAAMRRGQHLEAAIASWWEDEHGLRLVEPEVLYVYGDILIATLDRLVVGTDVAVEIKTTKNYVETPPRSWYWQCQSQILCADLKWVELAVLDPSMDLKKFIIEPDEKDQVRLIETAEKFLGHIRDGEMPPDVDLTYSAVSALFPEVETDTVDLEADTARWCRSLAALQGRIKSLQSDEDTLKAIIARRLGNAAEGRFGDRVLVTWRSMSRRDIDGKRLRHDLPEVAEEYGKTTKYRTLRLKA
jgi:putative phage-type endonuclease